MTGLLSHFPPVPADFPLSDLAGIFLLPPITGNSRSKSANGGGAGLVLINMFHRMFGRFEAGTVRWTLGIAHRF